MIGNWLKRKIQIASVNAATEDLERFLKSLRGASGEEISMLIVVATIIRDNMRKTGRLPDSYMKIPEPGDGSACATLYLSRLIRMFQKNGQPTDAAGAMVWLHTLRCLALPELRALGREMWGELQRGFPYMERSFSEIEAVTNSSVSAEVRREARFLPSDLAPPMKAEGRVAHAGVLPEKSEDYNSSLQEMQDDVARRTIETAKLLGATSAREAAEMLMGRPLTNEEWISYRDAWERNWRS